MNARQRSFPAGKNTWHQRVIDPNLRLKGSLGDRYEADQKHIVDLYETFTDSPPILDGPV